MLVGITHSLFHGSTWHPRVCYLQDLFVDPAARGQGALRLDWHTQADNVVARALYDKVARYRGFIRYEFPLA